MSAAQSPGDVIAELWPLGTYGSDQTVSAVSAAAELVRYLNHATQPADAGQALPHPQAAYAGIGGLHEVMSHLPQLLRQVADQMMGFAGDPRLAVDELGELPVGGAPTLAYRAAGELNAAGALAGAVAAHVNSALQAASRLYLRADEADGGASPPWA